MKRFVPQKNFLAVFRMHLFVRPALLPSVQPEMSIYVYKTIVDIGCISLPPGLFAGESLMHAFRPIFAVQRCLRYSSCQ